MEKGSFLLLICCLVVIPGCTPFGDGLLRRSDQEQTAELSAPPALSEEAMEAPKPLVDGPTRNIVRTYGPTIKRYAERYGLDWRLILATMKQESRFSATAESHRGAYGLMQLMPGTRDEIARQLDVEDLSHPSENIRGGVYYLRQLYDLFENAGEPDRIKLTLAAYNAGIGRVYDAQELAVHLHRDPLTWESVREMLPLLSPRHESLHRSVWNQDRPRTGFFRNPQETIHYVDNVMSHYDEYQLLLN